MFLADFLELKSLISLLSYALTYNKRFSDMEDFNQKIVTIILLLLRVCSKTSKILLVYLTEFMILQFHRIFSLTFCVQQFYFLLYLRFYFFFRSLTVTISHDLT